MAYRLLLRNVAQLRSVYRPTHVPITAFSSKSVVPVPDTLTVAIDTPVSLKELSGLPPNHVARYVVIFKPGRCTAQSGTEATHTWRIEFETQQRWENPAMGWASSGDPFSNLVMEFYSKEAAISYAEENGFKYKVKEPAVILPIKKLYAANFSWNKRTRVTNK